VKKTKQDGKADAGKTLLLLEAGYALTNFSVTPHKPEGRGLKVTVRRRSKPKQFSE